MLKALLTEKTMRLARDENQYTFLVSPRLRKPQARELISRTFGVHVESVNSRSVSGKTKRFGKKRIAVRQSDYKKVIATLPEKERINLFEAEEKSSKGRSASGGKGKKSK